jgi:hypothetical protein
MASVQADMDSGAILGCKAPEKKAEKGSWGFMATAGSGAFINR